MRPCVRPPGISDFGCTRSDSWRSGSETRCVSVPQSRAQSTAAVNLAFRDLAQSTTARCSDKGRCDVGEARRVSDGGEAVAFLSEFDAGFTGLAGDIFMAVQDQLGGERWMPTDLDGDMPQPDTCSQSTYLSGFSFFLLHPRAVHTCNNAIVVAHRVVAPRPTRPHEPARLPSAARCPSYFDGRMSDPMVRSECNRSRHPTYQRRAGGRRASPARPQASAPRLVLGGIEHAGTPGRPFNACRV